MLILLNIKQLYELLPVDEGLGLELAIVQEKVDLFGCEGNVETPKGLFEHEIGDLPTFLLVCLQKGLLKCLGTGR